jgi:hypothetical protein
MENIVFSKNYIWRHPDNVYFVTLQINATKQYKLIMDIRYNKIGIKSDNPEIYEENTKISSKWYNYGDELEGNFEHISSNHRYMRNMFEIGFDVATTLHILPNFSKSLLFRRKYLDVPYPAYGHIGLYRFEYECSSINEFWLIGDDQMTIRVIKVRAFCNNLTVCQEKHPRTNIEYDVIESIQIFDWVDKIRAGLDDIYPCAELCEWILEESIQFYTPIIIEKINSVNYFPGDIIKLITKYVIC